MKLARIANTRDASAPVRCMPLTEALWPQLEELFGRERGANCGCWCMWWRVARSEWYRLGRHGRRQRFRELVREAQPTGVLLFRAGVTLGWCAIAPRSSYPTIARSTVARAVDADVSDVWFISCFYVKAGQRGRGITGKLIEASAAYARDCGARCVEACPTNARCTSHERCMGVLSTFLHSGFRVTQRRSEHRFLVARHFGGRLPTRQTSSR